MVISRLTTAQRDTLNLGTEKCIIFNIDTNKHELWNGSSWGRVATLNDISNAGNPINIWKLVYSNK
jgi:hypothetical protein